MRVTALRSLDVADAVARAKGAPTLAPPNALRLAPPANDSRMDPAVAWLRRQGLGTTGSAELLAALEIGKAQWLVTFDLLVELNAMMVGCLLNLKHDVWRGKGAEPQRRDSDAIAGGEGGSLAGSGRDRIAR